MPEWESTVSLGMDTNMGLALDRMTTAVTYTTDGETFEPAAEGENGWISDVSVNEDFITFTTAENTTSDTRIAKITVSVYDNVSRKTYSASCLVNQEAENGYFRFDNPDTPAEVESFAKDEVLPWTTNMEMFFDNTTVTVSYDEPGEEWISNITLEPDGLHASILESTYHGERHATITITYSGPQGTVTTTRKVVQAEPALEIAFADLRAKLTAAGTYAPERDFILARVISDPGNPNSETNPKPTWDTVDQSESTRTAYIQSLDGQYGFRVKLADGVDPNILPRYAMVKIALAGLTIEREDNPTRYTIRNMSASNILETTAGSESDITSKTKHINQLTDDDINTFVVLQDMEVAVPRGSWINLRGALVMKSDLNSKGLAGKSQYDCGVRFFRDINGDHIPMLVNAETPWRINTNEIPIPVGSGTVGAVVVYAPLQQQNANNEMGRYQIRVFKREDMNLDKSVSSFSKNIAVWKWQSASDIIRPDATDKTKVKANEGEGFMSTNVELGKDCNVLTGGFYTEAWGGDNITRAFYYCGANWWDFTAPSGSRGKSITWEFSTKGISGKHLTLSLAVGGGYQHKTDGKVPTQWNIEYSTDGVNFTSVKKKWVIYQTVVNGHTAMDAPGGNAEHVFDLPDEMFGHDKGYVRMKVAAKVTYDINKGVIGGNLTQAKQETDKAKNYLRFECISIKYNK